MAERSHAYPSHTIAEMVEFVQKINSKYGSSLHIKREDIATALNLAEVTIQSDCSTAVQYGLLEMKSKVGYKPTPLFTSIYKPLNDAEKKGALIEALSNPELYSQLIAQFNNDILPVEGLPTILFRSYHISEKVSAKAANIFIENVKYLNLIDAEGKLRLTGIPFNNEIENQEQSDSAIPINNAAIVHKPVIENTNNGNQQEQRKASEEIEESDSDNNEYIGKTPLPFNILLKKKRTARLIIPSDSTREDLVTITNWINLMKDSFE